MYLSKEEVSMLDETIKYFEVGFRSYIADMIISKYKTIDEYRIAITSKRMSFSGEAVILSHKIETLLKKLAKESQIKRVYTLLTETQKNCENKIPVNIKTESRDVFLVVSDIISLTYVFGMDLFSDMLLKFNSREEYMYLVEQYRIVRNNIAHPEASIGNNNYFDVNRLISKFINYIEDKYFWYVSKNELKKKMDGLTISVNNSLRIINNLSLLPKQKNKFVCRVKEIETIKTYLSGNEAGMGRMHYILIDGFGGMGKTALITEVTMQLIKDYNNHLLRENRWFDFILFFTAKEEVLDVDDSKKISSYQLKSQISSLEDIKSELVKYLETDDLISIDKRGLIIIDNFETLPEEEKKKIDNFIIYKSKLEIQFVITSRNNEYVGTNYQLQLKAFDKNDGIEFVNKYIEENNLLIELSKSDKEKLVLLSKGNTIVLVLSINRISKGVNLSVIERELSSIGSETINNIVNFMAKNSFDEIYKQYISRAEEIDKILQVLVMYDDPIDKYSLKILSGTELDFVNHVVTALVSGLILEEKKEEIQINEYAKTYLIIKFRPSRIEYVKKVEEISRYKRRLSIRRNKLLDCRKRNPQIDNLLKEWQPNNIIDELAILESFEAYIYFGVGNFDHGKKRRKKEYNLGAINDYFSKIEETSRHPYIYAQKARILLPLLKLRDANKQAIRECLEDSFEKTIISVETQYTNIKGTVSYASILRELGRFYLENIEIPDYDKSASHSEKARDIYIKINPNDKYYFFTIRNLSIAYIGLYEQTKDEMYLSEAKKFFQEILQTNSNNFRYLKKEASEYLAKYR